MLDRKRHGRKDLLHTRMAPADATEALAPRFSLLALLVLHRMDGGYGGMGLI